MITTYREGDEIEFEYRNHEGKVTQRRVRFETVDYGTNEQYGEHVWYMRTHDLERDEPRSFAFANITPGSVRTILPPAIAALPKEPTYAQRVATARAEVIEQLAAHFEQSGVEYTCLAVVHRVIEPKLAELAKLPRYAPYNVNTRRTINRAADIVHKRWQRSSKGEAVEPVVTCPDCGITVFASSDNTTGRCTGCEMAAGRR